MKITFNGTAGSEGFPALFCECEHCTSVRKMEPINFRKRSSCLIDESLLIDFSPDTYASTLFGKLDLTKVKDIIFTHSHADHFYPQDLSKIMPPYGNHNRKEPLHVYGNSSIGEHMEGIGISEPKLSQYLDFQLLKAHETYKIGGYEITPLPAKHDSRQECFIYMIGKGGKVILYGHDSAYFPEESWEAFNGVKFDCVILDCTSGTQDCPFASHMGLPDNIKVKQRMIENDIADSNTKFIITHFAHSFAPFKESMEQAAAEHGMLAVYDGFEVQI
jgi:phosphoribosyl 1,2-cyclic phosphate phosphodiesterase